MQKYEPIVISDLTHLNGKLLIATPYYSFNDIFKKSIIYIMSSKKEYSMGLILNQKISDKYSYPDMDVNLSENFELFLGGPVEPKRCFVIHSGEYTKNILHTNNDISVSSNKEIIEDIKKGIGPQKTFIAMGYTYWYKGQMEEELKNNFWIVAESSQELFFSHKNNNKWEQSLIKAGIKHYMFSNSSSLS